MQKVDDVSHTYGVATAKTVSEKSAMKWLLQQLTQLALSTGQNTLCIRMQSVRVRCSQQTSDNAQGGIRVQGQRC